MRPVVQALCAQYGAGGVNDGRLPPGHSRQQAASGAIASLVKRKLTAVGACRWRRCVRWRTSGRSARWRGRSAAPSWPSAPTGASCAFMMQRRYVLAMVSVG